MPFAAAIGRSSYLVMAKAYLFLPTVVLLLIIKVEALTYDKNLIVALLLGLAGVIYLERGRALKCKVWFALSQVILIMGLAHLFMVNFTQEGNLGPLSLRLLTVLPYFGLLLYAYLTWPGVKSDLDLKKPWAMIDIVYLYLMSITLLTFFLYEVPRGWVLICWGCMALACLAIAGPAKNGHLRLIALCVCMLVVGRGFITNLIYRDELGDVRLNMVLVPAACLLLLGGYLLSRIKELRSASVPMTPAATTWQKFVVNERLLWLLSAALLMFGFIWVEVSGTMLTVWLSLLGLALILLGFLLKERAARLTGLFVLCCCIGKLLVYDMRGLAGMYRILSVGVVGVVLIVVGFVYLHFKERFKDIL
jgi:hypothetical protein